MLNTDHLAAWADETLIWDLTSQPDRIGKLSDPALKFLLPQHREWLKEREDQCTGLGQRNFSLKLIKLLRDTLVLPLPVGNPGSGSYRLREAGSAIHQVRLRILMHLASSAMRKPTKPKPLGNAMLSVQFRHGQALRGNGLAARHKLGPGEKRHRR